MNTDIKKLRQKIIISKKNLYILIGTPMSSRKKNYVKDMRLLKKDISNNNRDISIIVKKIIKEKKC